MTALDLARVRAQRVDLARLLLTVLAAVPYLLGRTAALIVTAASFTVAALVLGWNDGRPNQKESP